MTAAAPLTVVADDELRRQRRVRLAATPGRYGLDFVEVVAAEPTRWALRLVFVPDLSGSSKGHGRPPGLRPEQITVCLAADATAAMLPEITSLRFGAAEGDAIVLEVALREAPPLAVQRGALAVSLDHVPEVDPLFCREAFHLQPERGPGAGDGAAPADVATQGASYAVKDYAGFRGLMMDRLRLTLPAWQERSPADVGVMLVELMAYAADYLSYEQDAAATEAYLRTARKRRSLRRHAVLLDYDVDEGCSARAFVQIDLAGTSAVTLPAGCRFQTETAPPIVFESLHDLTVLSDHDAMALYGWGIEPFVVPAGATEIVLEGNLADLRAGDVIMLISDGDPGASPSVHPVRLDRAPVLDHDPVMGVDITRIAWSGEEALPFALRAGRGPHASVARGNVVLAEHHATFATENVLPGEGPGLFVVQLRGSVPEAWQGQSLAVASAAPYDHDAARARPAAAALVQDKSLVRPWVQVSETRGTYNTAWGDGGAAWTCRKSFLASARFARDVVVDVDDGDRIQLAFGDGSLTRALSPGAKLVVRFGVGGGLAGNVGSGTLRVIDGAAELGAGVTLTAKNWLPAEGGREPESSADIRLRAPIAFLEQERCVSAGDFADVAKRVPGVRDAAATFTWTGSANAAVVHVLPERSDALDGMLEAQVSAYLFARRLAGTDLLVRPPRYVPVAVSLRVGLAPGYDAWAIRKVLDAELGDGTLADGRRGLFHRDGFGFGQPVYLAPVLARAAAVPGVAFVDAVAFRRWSDVAGGAAPATQIPIGPVEIARVRRDLTDPNAGLVTLSFEGGR
jgi:Baseplate J-like protein